MIFRLSTGADKYYRLSTKKYTLENKNVRLYKKTNRLTLNNFG